MSQVAKEYARIKLRKLKLAGLAAGILISIFGFAVVLVGIVFLPIWLPAELAKAGYPNLAIAVFFGIMFLLGGWFWWQHSDLRKAIQNTKQELRGNE